MKTLVAFSLSYTLTSSMCKQIVKFTYPCTHYAPPHHHQTSCLSVTPVSCDCHDLVTFDLIKSLDGWKKINYSIKIINIIIHNNICKSHPLSYDEGKREQLSSHILPTLAPTFLGNAMWWSDGFTSGAR